MAGRAVREHNFRFAALAKPCACASDFGRRGCDVLAVRARTQHFAADFGSGGSRRGWLVGFSDFFASLDAGGARGLSVLQTPLVSGCAWNTGSHPAICRELL